LDEGLAVVVHEVGYGLLRLEDPDEEQAMSREQRVTLGRAYVAQVDAQRAADDREFMAAYDRLVRGLDEPLARGPLDAPEHQLMLGSHVRIFQPPQPKRVVQYADWAEVASDPTLTSDTLVYVATGTASDYHLDLGQARTVSNGPAPANLRSGNFPPKSWTIPDRRSRA
jgi:hypothetical protein